MKHVASERHVLRFGQRTIKVDGGRETSLYRERRGFVNPYTTFIALLVGSLLLFVGIRTKKWPIIVVAMLPLGLIAFNMFLLITGR